MPLDYKSAGVDIARGNQLVSRIKSLARHTWGPEVLADLGGFGALFDLSSHKYREPVLVAGADGAGTKVKLAAAAGRHDSIGIDLVAMCVNDVLAQGALPLFFLDYFACSSLDADIAESVIAGIARGCGLAGCALVGGETAEMPGMYQPGEYDLAGFCVGIVEKQDIINGAGVQAGDVLVALPSSGPHANGFSLIRKVLEVAEADLADTLDGAALADLLLEPTRIYKDSVFALLPEVRVKAIAHITGGGLTENLPRVIPRPLCARVEQDSRQWPPLFQWLQETGGISTPEMYRTFNCGVGMVLAVAPEEADDALRLLQDAGTAARRLGTIEERDGANEQVLYADA